MAFEKVKETIVGIFKSNDEKPPEDDLDSEIVDIQNHVYKEDVVALVNREFDRRKEERMPFELQWRLNMNFIQGNQFCDINQYSQTIMEIDKLFDYEERQVYHQIAPITETRLSKLGRLRPAMAVRPATSDISDVSTAKVCKAILDSASNKLKLSKKINLANAWMEQTGTVFYKNTWDYEAGQLIGYIDGQPIYEGDNDSYIANSFEIYPDSNYRVDLNECRSLIHAKAYDVDTINEHWNVDIAGHDVDVYSMSETSTGTGGLGYNVTNLRITNTILKNAELVKEYYEMPTKKYPEGRLIIVAGSELLYYGNLPYVNQEDKKRGYPFVRCVDIENPGCFWGTSIIERLIPIQRSYNALKNRKTEYLNRVSIGCYDYEEDTIDEDELEDLQDNGMYPGKIIARARGSQPLHAIENGTLPTDFIQEEAKLENLFIVVSGTSELARNSSNPTGVTSGTGLSILKEQDDTRISLTADHVKDAIIEVAKQWLRLYKQFAKGPRLSRTIGSNNDVMVRYWTANDITSDDVIFDVDNDMLQTPSQRKQFVSQVFGMGLLNDPDTGKISRRMRSKILELLNMGNWESADDIEQLHINRATKENFAIQEGTYPKIKYVDDDSIHIFEHVRFILSGDFEKLENERPDLAEVMNNHVEDHRRSMVVKQGQQQDVATQMQSMNNQATAINDPQVNPDTPSKQKQ